MDLTSIKIFFPEIFLSIFILFQLFLNSIVITNFKNNYPIIHIEIFSQCFFLICSLFFLFINDGIEAYFFNHIFDQDLSILFVKQLVTLTSIFSFLSIMRGFISQNLNFFEYYSIFLIALLATLLLISSSNLLSVYLVLEMQTLSFYILSCFKRNSAFSTEAGLKYFVIGSFISGLFLFGSSYIYGLTGILNFNDLIIILNVPFLDNASIYRTFLYFSILLITIVFLFKISAVPFHFWSPDVYEGSPVSSTIIFSVVPKIAIFYLFIKWVCVIDTFTEIKDLLLLSGVLSILLGSFLAFKQKRFKRLIIYSSIAQTGFLLCALSVNSLNSFVSIYFFLIIYIITSILIWTFFCLFFGFQYKINTFLNQSNYPLFLSTLSSFFKINNIWSASNIIIFFSLAGIPPLVGFFSKLFIISVVLDYKNLICSFILLMVSTVSVFYYLRIIKIVFFDESLKPVIDSSQLLFKDNFFNTECTLLSFLLFLIIFFFFFPYFLIYGCNLIFVNSFFFL